MTQVLLRLTLIAFAFALLADRPVRGQTAPRPGIEEISRLDRLPAFKRSIEVGSVSSYDRTGGNDDGFSGKYSYVRKEPAGLVIADLKGPGVVYRIWTPTPTDDLVEFYFDGEASPRIRVRFRDIFTGKEFPFLTPVVGTGAGGFYSYVPLPYKASCKVVVKAERVQFYQINYATYPPDVPVVTYSAESKEFEGHLERARKLFASSGSDVTPYTSPEGPNTETRRVEASLAPGKAVTLFESDRPGRVVGLRLGPASAFAGKERDVVLRCFWDGASVPAIECPVGDFFGYSWGAPAMKSLLVGTSGDTNNVYLPMPFEKSARIELVSERTGGPALDVRAEVVVSNAGRSKDEGALYAVWRRESPTTEGRPFTFLETEGRGHVVGFLLQAQGTQAGGVPEYFEGDDETTIDGTTTVRGTGSEDFFNGGWYDVPGRWEDRVSLPLSGCLDFKRHLGRTGGYRFLVGDAYAYTRSIRSTIEHGPTGNKIPADYAAVTFFYSDRPPAHAALPSLAERRVRDLGQTVFTPGWTTPIHAFSWINAQLKKTSEKLGDEDVRFLSFDARDGEIFGPHYISFICEMPAAGRYRISVEAIAGPAQAIVQLFRNEVAVGEPADLYAPERAKRAAIPMGVLNLDEGANRVMFKLVGKNERSSGLRLDLHRIIFERQ